MEYRINCISKEIFLTSLKNVKDIEENELRIEYCGIDINFMIQELLKFKKIRFTLFLHMLGLFQIPKNIYNLKNLKVLSLVCNLIDNIPFSIYKLQKLEMLWINNNSLKKFPLILYDLQNLKVIYVIEHKNIINNFKRKRLIFRLFFIFNKKLICNYKMLKRLINYN